MTDIGNPDRRAFESVQAFNASSTGEDRVPLVSYEPGGFWRRLAAMIIDGCITTVLQTPLSILFQVASLGSLTESAGMNSIDSLAVSGVLLYIANVVSSLVMTGFYYGWFYSRKGATPGKMLLGLRVMDSDTGYYLSFWKAVGRELLIKNLVFIFTLGIGWLIVAFRSDKRALHDMAMNTLVVRKIG